MLFAIDPFLQSSRKFSEPFSEATFAETRGVRAGDHDASPSTSLTSLLIARPTIIASVSCDASPLPRPSTYPFGCPWLGAGQRRRKILSSCPGSFRSSPFVVLALAMFDQLLVG